MNDIINEYEWMNKSMNEWWINEYDQWYDEWIMNWSMWIWWIDYQYEYE